MSKIDVENIRSLEGINRNLLGTWADSCSVLLDYRKHKSPVKFNVKGKIKIKSQLAWKAVKNKSGYEDLEQTAELAGYGMSLLIITTFDKKMIPVSRRAKGDGVDIVCSKEKKDDENFLSVTKEDFYIESKGTRNKSAVKTYLKAGIKQSEKRKGNVYVFSTEFETPASLTNFRINK